MIENIFNRMSEYDREHYLVYIILFIFMQIYHTLLLLYISEIVRTVFNGERLRFINLLLPHPRMDCDQINYF